MNQELTKRVEALENEVKQLRREIASVKVSQNQVNMEKQTSSIEAPLTNEKPLSKYFFPQQVKEESVLNTSVEKQDEKAVVISSEKPRRSLEETFLAMLPKIFMVILVLGVLWGLKLASDYGFLSDWVKIAAGYILSVLLAVAAYVMEQKKKGSPSLIIPLYGGAFIVGILTTAAGAIIYDVLSLNIALIIALVYIAYGIGISYWKQSEALTLFVAFTSLLLPYLLEYMEFNSMIIAMFVLVLMAALQLVIIKYKQTIALYVATFFSIFAIAFVMDLNFENTIYISIIAVLAIFYYSWWKICSDSVKLQNIHTGLLYGFSICTLGLLIAIAGLNFTPLSVGITLFVVQLAFTIFLWLQNKRMIFDVMGTVVILSLLNIIFALNLEFDLGALFTLIAVFAGLMVALKLRASFMKVMYTGLFLLTSLIIYSFHSTTPFFGIENLELLLVLLFLAGAYVYAKRPKENLNWLERNLERARMLEFVPVILFLFTWWYIIKFDEYHPVFATSEYGFSNGILADIVLAILIAVLLVLPEKYIGPMLPIIAFVLFVIKSLFIHLDPYLHDGVFMHEGLVRVIYGGVTIAILADIWKKGLIYKNVEKWLADKLDLVAIVAVLGLLYIVFGTTDFLNEMDKISWNVAVITNTFSVFIAAIVSLLLGNHLQFKNLKMTGILLLIFGFVKMIFFDLSNLDLFVRSILFIVIGGVGLLVSNRLTKK